MFGRRELCYELDEGGHGFACFYGFLRYIVAGESICLLWEWLVDESELGW